MVTNTGVSACCAAIVGQGLPLIRPSGQYEGIVLASSLSWVLLEAHLGGPLDV
jgi:hypothetical protein